METAVVLDNAKLTQLLQRPDVVQDFPFMSTMASRIKALNGKCTPCAKKKQNALDFEGLKATIGQMSAEQKQLFKSKIGATQVRVIYHNTRGQKVRLTF